MRPTKSALFANTTEVGCSDQVEAAVRGDVDLALARDEVQKLLIANLLLSRLNRKATGKNPKLRRGSTERGRLRLRPEKPPERRVDPAV